MTHPTIQLKSGVILDDCRIEIIRIFPTVMEVYATYGLPAVITSANDGRHMNGSRHYLGWAIDLRTYHLPGGYLGETAKAVALEIQNRIGPEYDVVLEKDHIHIEFDP